MSYLAIECTNLAQFELIRTRLGARYKQYHFGWSGDNIAKELLSGMPMDAQLYYLICNKYGNWDFIYDTINMDEVEVMYSYSKIIAMDWDEWERLYDDYIMNNPGTSVGDRAKSCEHKWADLSVFKPYFVCEYCGKEKENV